MNPLADPKVKKVHHVSLAVNAAKVAEAWERVLGVGGWKLNSDMSGVDAKGRKWTGKEYWTQIGDTVIEMIEPGEGRIVQSKFLDTVGPGVHHIALEVDDVDASLEAVLENGGQVVFHEPGKNWAYVRTGGPDGLVIEISCHA